MPVGKVKTDEDDESKGFCSKKKERNQMRSIDMQTAKGAGKLARKVVMQKVAGKGKNIADLSQGKTKS